MQAAFLQRHHASAEQFDAGAAIRGTLEGLQFVDLSFGLSVAPRYKNRAALAALLPLAYKLLPRPARRCAGQSCFKGLTVSERLDWAENRVADLGEQKVEADILARQSSLRSRPRTRIFKATN